MKTDKIFAAIFFLLALALWRHSYLFFLEGNDGLAGIYNIFAFLAAIFSLRNVLTRRPTF